MQSIPRIALFADTFHETNGAANVLRRLVGFAGRNNYPFLCIRSGRETSLRHEGSVSILELKRCPLAFKIEQGLRFDPFFWRHRSMIKNEIDRFKPDVLHVTGPNDISQIGLLLSHFGKINAVASWHTNVHEYAAGRLATLMKWMPCRARKSLTRGIESSVLMGLMKLNYVAQLQLAPNVEYVSKIREMTGRPTYLMSRGVDPELFSPKYRRDPSSDEVVLGYVGRLSTEKNVRMFAAIQSALGAASCHNNFRFVFVGEGAETEWLSATMKHAEFTGVLHGNDLSERYASMDLLVFPSKTDAFGNVVLEALASGVPSVVMPDNGPKYLIEDRINGFVARDDEDFVRIVVEAVQRPDILVPMKKAARESALAYSWEAIFQRVYDVYRHATQVKRKVRATDTDHLADDIIYSSALP